MSSDQFNPYQSPQIHSEPVAQPQDTELASRLTRFGGRWIDGFISIAVTFPIAFATGYFDRAFRQQLSIEEVLLQSAIGFALYLVIHGYLLATQGQTVGKYLVGVRIVDNETGKVIPLVKQFFLRDMITSVIAMIPVVGGLISLVGICLIFRADQRCLHDLLAGTKVVKA